MSESDSSLSSPPSTDDEMPSLPRTGKGASSSSPNFDGTLAAITKVSPKRKRPESPPHEEVLADSPDIAFIVMFRSRFHEAFSTKMPHFGPQDIERGVVDTLPSPQVESMLCALLALVLNRKKPVERGHYGRALEEAIQTQKSQWAKAWNGVNPLSGGRSLNTMTPQERLTLLRTLILWSMNTSEVVMKIIKDCYKQSRHNDDLNQPLSVQPWGRDGFKRSFWLVEGQDDTRFRLYREGDRTLQHPEWRSVAGTIDELKVVAEKLAEDGSQAARRLSDRITNAIPRFEATEEKRRRREYRQSRKAQFARPEPGFSLYEGRTRGKRMRYTFSDEEEEGSDATSTRRSTRQSGAATPTDPSKPTVTASGRQVRSRIGGAYGESLLRGQTTERASPATGEYVRSEGSEEPRASNTRATRSGSRPTANGWTKSRKHIDGYNSLDEIEDEDEATSSGQEWDGGDDDDAEDHMGADEEDEEGFSDEVSDEDISARKRSLLVKLQYRKPSGPSGTDSPGVHSSQGSIQPPTATSTTVQPKSSSLVDGRPPHNVSTMAAGTIPDGAPVKLDQKPPQQLLAVQQANGLHATTTHEPPPTQTPLVTVKHALSLAHMPPAAQTSTASYMPAATCAAALPHMTTAALPQNPLYLPATTCASNQSYAPTAAQSLNGTHIPPASYVPNPAYTPPAGDWQ